MGPRLYGAGVSARPFRLGEIPQTDAIVTGRLLITDAPARRPAASGGGPRERLPTGIAGSRATGPIRGKWLQAVLAQGGEVDRKVDRAEDPLGEACAAFGHRGRD